MIIIKNSLFLCHLVIGIYFLWLALSMHREIINATCIVKGLVPVQLPPPSIKESAKENGSVYGETTERNINMKHDESENATLVLIND